MASLVSSCPAHVTLPLSSVVCHRPSFLRILPTVACSSPVSLSSSSTLPSLPLTPPFFSCLPSLLLLFFVPSCFRTLAVFVVVVIAKVSVPYKHAGVTQVLMPFSLLEIRQSASPPLPPQLLSKRLLRSVHFDVPLSPSSRPHTLSILGTRNCPSETVSSPPALCPALQSSLG